jgi:ATP-binding cassette, subfamily B, bacterial PglK
MFIKILDILDFRIKIKLLFIFFFYLFTIFLDFLSISIVPILIGTLFSPDLDPNNKFYYLFETFKSFDSNLILVLIILIFILKNILQSFMIYYEQKLLSNFYLKNTKKLMQFYFNKNLIEHSHLNPTYFVRNIVNESKVIKNTIISYLSIFKDIFNISGIFLILSIVNWKVTTIIFLLFLVIHLFYDKFIKRIVKKKSETNMSLRGILSKTILEYYNSIIDIKLSKKEDFLISEYQKNNATYENNDIILNLFRRLPRFLLETISIIIICFSLMILVEMEIDSSEILILVSLLTLSILRLFPSFSSLSINLVALKINKPSTILVSQQIKEFEKLNLSNNFKNNNKSFNIDLKNINFKDVDFFYNKDKNIISSLNLQLKSKNFIGITGSSGSGKTTFLNLLIGLIDPNKGKILINDEQLEDIKYKWFDNVSYVAQNIFLLDDTIKRNITFGISENDIDQNLLNNCIKIACIDKFLSKELSLNTVIGNNGAKISGGQKQRIAIARALYRKPQVLILDEAMNAMDDALQEEVIKNIKDISLSLVIMVTHEHKLLQICDKKYLFKENKFQEI